MRASKPAEPLFDLVRGLLDAGVMRPLLFAIIAGLSVAVAAGCGPTSDPTAGHSTGETMGAELEPGEDSEGDVGDEGIAEDGPIVGADDSVPGLPDNSDMMLSATQARTTANLNLRKSANTSAAILAVIPSGTVVALASAVPTNGFFKVTYNGVTGYAHSSYLDPLDGSGDSGSAVDVDGPASPANAIARAKAAVGFSYWWGGGAWLESGATSSTRGSCTGSCPSCSHSGRYGADCSGLVAKAWQFGTKALSSNSHPYSTADFASDASGRWSTVSRSSLRAADALVYRSGGSGHIAMYEKGDGWGTPTVYECRSCAYGCVHNARSFSGYKGIRRSGF